MGAFLSALRRLRRQRSSTQKATTRSETLHAYYIADKHFTVYHGPGADGIVGPGQHPEAP